MTSHDTVQEDLEVLLGFLMDVKENHPSAMYSSGIDPKNCADLESLMDQVSFQERKEILYRHILIVWW